MIDIFCRPTHPRKKYFSEKGYNLVNMPVEGYNLEGYNLVNINMHKTFFLPRAKISKKYTHIRAIGMTL